MIKQLCDRMYVHGNSCPTVSEIEYTLNQPCHLLRWIQNTMVACYARLTLESQEHSLPSYNVRTTFL